MAFCIRVHPWHPWFIFVSFSPLRSGHAAHKIDPAKPATPAFGRSRHLEMNSFPNIKTPQCTFFNKIVHYEIIDSTSMKTDSELLCCTKTWQNRRVAESCGCIFCFLISMMTHPPPRLCRPHLVARHDDADQGIYYFRHSFKIAFKCRIFLFTCTKIFYQTLSFQEHLTRISWRH